MMSNIFESRDNEMVLQSHTSSHSKTKATNANEFKGNLRCTALRYTVNCTANFSFVFKICRIFGGHK